MASIPLFTAVLAGLLIVAVVSTIPYGLTAIEFRRRDNGLAYLLLVAGVGIWNAMFVFQLLTPDPLVKVFFLSLSVVGAVFTGLGWFLFATTASSTASTFDRSWIYAAVGILGGLDITMAVTAPVHSFYWGDPTGGGMAFVVVSPALGYWLHTVVIAGLFVAGAWLFAGAWQSGTNRRYSQSYTIVGLMTALATLGGNSLIPGGLTIAPIAAAMLTSIGWLQATRGGAIVWLRARL